MFTILTILDHFGLFWTILDHFEHFFCHFDTGGSMIHAWFLRYRHVTVFVTERKAAAGIGDSSKEMQSSS